MKLMLKFKDGMTVTQDLGSPKSVGEGQLLDLIQKAKEQNGPIVIGEGENQIRRTFNELYSMEIIMN